MTDQIVELLMQLRAADADHLDVAFPATQRALLLRHILHGGSAPPETQPEAHPELIAVRLVRVARRHLLPTLAIAVAVIVGALVLLTGSAIVRPSSAVAFSTGPRGEIIATVTDAFAAQHTLNTAFRNAGLKISVTLVPVSPSLVGTATAYSGPSQGPQIEALGRGACITAGGGCPIGVKIPRAFTGHGSITLGRPAKPGEDYVSTTSAFAPGESLHCSGMLNKQIVQGLAVIRAKKITAYWGRDPFNIARDTRTTPSTTRYIVDATPVSAGVVVFNTRPKPLPTADAKRTGKQFNQGC